MAYRVLLELRNTKNVTIGVQRYPVVTKAIMKNDIADNCVRLPSYDGFRDDACAKYVAAAAPLVKPHLREISPPERR